MNLTSKPHVSFSYALNFRELEKRIRFEQAAAEDAFGSMVNAQSQQTNLPDDYDPTQPRIMFPSDKKSVMISQAACQLSMNFGVSEHAFSSSFDIAKRSIESFTTKATQFRPSSSYGAHAFVIELRFAAQESNEELAAFLHQRFIKTDTVGEPASIQLQLGFKYEGLYLNLTCNPYETRQLPAIPPTQGFVRADMLTIIDRGIQIRIDVNNLTDFQTADSASTPARLLAAANKFVKEQLGGIAGVSIE